MHTCQLCGAKPDGYDGDLCLELWEQNGSYFTVYAQKTLIGCGSTIVHRYALCPKCFVTEVAGKILEKNPSISAFMDGVTAKCGLCGKTSNKSYEFEGMVSADWDTSEQPWHLSSQNLTVIIGLSDGEGKPPLQMNLCDECFDGILQVDPIIDESYI